MYKRLLFLAMGAIVLLGTIAAAPAAPLYWSEGGGASCSQVFAKIQNDGSTGMHYDGYVKANGVTVFTQPDASLGKTDWAQVSWTPPANFVGSVEAYVEIYHGNHVVSDSKDVTGNLNCATHQYGAYLTIATTCGGYTSTVHITDFSVDISTVAGPSGTWSKPFVLESASVNATATLPDGTKVPLSGTAYEPTECQQTHAVTWNTSSNCTGWSASYAIDGGAPVSYDQGTWSNPYVLETANPKAFTVPENPGELYDHPNAPSVTVYESGTCQSTHKVTWSTSANCTGWSASYAIDGGASVNYASGTWTKPFILESVDVPAFNIPMNAGELYDHSQVPIQHIDEPKGCQQTHQVSWDKTSNCEGWSAFYSIDGGPNQVYASGSWSKPYVLESVEVPAFNIPENAGELYSADQAPAVTIDEPKGCQQTHQVSWDKTSNCEGWSAFYSIDGGPNQVYASGSWSKPYVLESVEVPAFNIPENAGELYSADQAPAVTIDEPKGCQQTHQVSWDKTSNCEGWSAFYSIDGGPNQVYASGSWSKPYVLESVEVPAFNIPENAGELYSADQAPAVTIDEPKGCQQTHQVSWDKTSNCEGWSAFYSIDGGPNQVYASGSWSKPYVLESVEVPAFNIPENAGELYSADQAPAVTIDEPKGCQQTHQVSWDKTSNCEGWSAFYSIDGGPNQVYASGSWSKPYVLESVEVPAFNIPENAGELYSADQAPAVTIDEPKGCQQTHQVSWDKTSNCEGWSAFYSIDGGPNQVYASGSWSKPYVLESVEVPAFNIPENAGELYSADQAPAVTIDEPKGCQQTHQVSWDKTSNCEGWSAFYSIDGGPNQVYASGSWSKPYVLESVEVPAFNIPENAGELYSADQAPAVTIDEPGTCQNKHVVTWNTSQDCKGWEAFYAIDGGAPVVYASGTWKNPYVLESVDVPAYDLPPLSGEVYAHPQIPSQHIDETKDCERHQTSVSWVKVSCSWGRGTVYAFTIGEGVKVTLDGPNGFHVVLSQSGNVTLPVGLISGEIETAPGYDLVGDKTFTIKVTDCPVVIVGNLILLINENASNGDTACALMARPGVSNVSVDIQKAACYPKSDPNWTATKVPCRGPVFADGGWPACMAIARQYMPIFSLKKPKDLHDLWMAFMAGDWARLEYLNKIQGYDP